MKQIKKFLIPLPIFLVATLYFARIAFNDLPFYYKGLSDPSYSYFEAALHIAKGEFPRYVDHPGAPIEYIGAITFKITYWWIGKGNFTEDALNRSELYLRNWRFVLIAIALVSIYIGGFYIFKLTNCIWTTFLIQTSPFLSTSILGDIHRFQTISPEIFFIPLGITWLIFFAKFLKKIDRENLFKICVNSACLVGLMIATKLTFLPFAIIALFWLPSWRLRLYYVVFTILFFLLFAFAQFFSSDKLFIWTRDLFFSSGAYATGERTIINPTEFINNLTSFVQNDFLFALCTLLNISVILLKKNLQQHYRKTLLGITASQILFIVMNAKHYVHSYYIYGGIFLIPASFGLLYLIFEKITIRKNIVGISVVIGVFFTSYHLYRTFSVNLSYQKEEVLQVENFYQKYPNTMVVTQFEAISLPYALSLGISAYEKDLGNPYGDFLKKKYPNDFFYHNDTYTYWGKKINIDSVIRQKDTFMFHHGLIDVPRKDFQGFLVRDSLITASGNKIYVYIKNK
ncbi:MAG: hypothetical protein RMJ97_07120 [Raineya sp.]|nr:hypothetical protein [Raineya sp.]MDW8296641.1 hypothetical protein [Raineya sp.]